MNRAVKLNYLFIGVIGGMLAMWACGDDGAGSGGSKSSGSGSTAAHAQEPSSCSKWSIKVFKSAEYYGAPAIDPGYEPFGVAEASAVYGRRCED